MYKATLCTFPTWQYWGVLRPFVMGFVLSFLISGIVKYLIYSYWCAQRTSAIFIQYSWSVFNVRIFFFCSIAREYFSKPAFFSLPWFSFLPPFPFCFHHEALNASHLRYNPTLENTLQSLKLKFLQEKHAKEALLPIFCVSLIFIFAWGVCVGVCEAWRGEWGRCTGNSFSAKEMHFQAPGKMKKWTFSCFSCLKRSWICVVQSCLEYLMPKIAVFSLSLFSSKGVWVFSLDFNHF